MEGKYAVKLSITELIKISRKRSKRYNGRLWKMQIWSDSIIMNDLLKTCHNECHTAYQSVALVYILHTTHNSLPDVFHVTVTVWLTTEATRHTSTDRFCQITAEDWQKAPVKSIYYVFVHFLPGRVNVTVLLLRR